MIYLREKLLIFYLGLMMIPLTSFKQTEIEPLKKIKISYTLEISLGHPYSACGGYCCFNFITHTFYHLPCFGEGSDCKHTIKIDYELMPNHSGVSDVTLDLLGEVDYADLPLPNRSLPIFDENENLIYLNIPEQIIHVANFNPALNTIYSIQNCTITQTPKY